MHWIFRIDDDTSIQSYSIPTTADKLPEVDHLPVLVKGHVSGGPAQCACLLCKATRALQPMANGQWRSDLKGTIALIRPSLWPSPSPTPLPQQTWMEMPKPLLPSRPSRLFTPSAMLAEDSRR
mmetsp:Transcript_72168/g.121117  ORF Transcript_72168/g.121117 Transcript_72168/m.121117 type:complete len:123 (-) Transcript_72168:1173-1541(-)